MIVAKQNLVGWWCPSVGSTGFRLLDRSGRNNHGTLTNMDPATDWVISGGKGALDFDGFNDHVAGMGNMVTTPNRSVSIWFQSTSTTAAEKWLFGSNSGSTGTAFGILQISGIVYVTQFGDSMNSTVSYSDGNWHQCVATHVGSSWTLYLDGRSITTKTMTTNPTSSVINLGRNPFGGVNPFPGQLDDVRLYNRALTAGEVRRLWQIGRGNIPLRRRRRYTEQSAGGFKGYWANRQHLIGSGVY
jgi:Concanavalin A-like lectin/glucanases superfamily